MYFGKIFLKNYIHFQCQNFTATCTVRAMSIGLDMMLMWWQSYGSGCDRIFTRTFENITSRYAFKRVVKNCLCDYKTCCASWSQVHNDVVALAGDGTCTCGILKIWPKLSKSGQNMFWGVWFKTDPKTVFLFCTKCCNHIAMPLPCNECWWTWLFLR